MSTTDNAVRDLGQRWVRAELHGDVAALDDMATEDFTLVGPLGFILDKQQWLDRYATGAFVTTALVWDEVEVREHGEVAISIGRHTQQASYQGRPSDGRFRITHIMVRRGDQWLLAGVHMSPIAEPPRDPQNGAA